MQNYEELTGVAVRAALAAGDVIMKVYQGGDMDVQIKDDDSPVTVADLQANAVITGMLGETGLPVLSEEGRDIPFEERRSWEKFWLVDPLDGTKEFISRNGEFTVNIALIKYGNPVAGVVYAPVNELLYTGIAGKGAWRIDHVRSGDTGTPDPGSQFWIKEGRPLPCVRHKSYGIVASRSFLDDRTGTFIDKFTERYPGTRIVTRGSSLKLCMLAEGEADIYPRFSNISEWDTAAGHAILIASGGEMVQVPDIDSPLVYNKPDSRNPWFVAFNDRQMLERVKDLIPGE